MAASIPSTNSTPSLSANRLPGVMSQNDFLVVQYVSGASMVGAASMGVVTNLINIGVFLRMGLTDGVVVSFLGLSVSDFSLSFFNLANGMALLLDTVDTQVGPVFYLQPMVLRLFFGNIAVMWYFVTVLLTLFIATARCLCVVRPLEFRHTFTVGRCGAFIVAANLTSLVVHVPPLALMGAQEQVKNNVTRLVQWESPMRAKVHTPIRLFTWTSLPMAIQIILVICVAVMYWALRKALSFRMTATTSRAHPNMSENENSKDVEGQDADDVKLQVEVQHLSKKDLQVIRQMILITVVFVIFNTPMVVLGVASELIPGFGPNKQKDRYFRMFFSSQPLRRALEQVNSSVNIFIYLKYNSRFWNVCTQALWCPGIRRSDVRESVSQRKK